MTIRMTNLGKGLHTITINGHTYVVNRVDNEFRIFHSGPRPDLKARKKKGRETMNYVGTYPTMKLAKAAIGVALTMLESYTQVA